MMLAGDTWLVNFQFDEATIPTRYVRDTGQVFGTRESGLVYGWSSDHTDQSRERSLHPDQRLDTLVHVEVGQFWEFQLPNGSYEVTVAVGDPANNDGIHTVNIEGTNFFDAIPDGDEALFATHTVTVSDGRLTLDVGTAPDKATRVNFIHIVGVNTSGNQPPAPPTITEPAVDGQIVNPGGVHMEAINFVDPEGDEHKSTDWEIWTVGPNAEVVWQTLGIQGVERLHTHMGDGLFVNSRAGLTSIAANTPHELRVRFRDDTGAVSDYAVRQFVTGEASATFPMEIEGIRDTPTPTWVEAFGSSVQLSDGTTLVSPSDPIIAIDLNGGSNSPGNEPPQNAIDGTLAKYLNFGEVNSGFILTPSNAVTPITSFRITTANDGPERDPTSWAWYGTNDAITSANHSTGTAENWTLIDTGTVSLPNGRNMLGPVVTIDNAQAFSSYRMVFTGVKNAGAANSMQIAEIAFFSDSPITGTPASLRLESADGAHLLLKIEGDPAPGNAITTPPAIDQHVKLRLVIESGSGRLKLRESDLVFLDEHGTEFTIYLPAIDLAPGQRLDLWISDTGATYYGTPLQTEPTFNLLARAAALTVPYVVNRPGFVIEEVGSDYRLPVNIAFVPDPGPNPDDPLYYVTELYGSIQVVTRDGTRHEFASGLLDYNPQGPISGSGEQGLSGIAVVRDEVNPEIYHLYVGMLWDNGSPPGGASHYPKVERIDSAPGGLAMASRTVLLNMQPETQGQSHQISNISIGPDGLLYVHNGDGFDASTALNLDQYRGKILRMNLDGTPATNNPFYDPSNGINARDYVFAYGFRNPFGGAWRASDGHHYSVENGPSRDRFAQVNEGVNYGWNGSDASMSINAIYNWQPSTAPVNITFVQRETFLGSALPADMMDHAFVSESGTTYAQGPQANGKRLTEFVLDANGQHVSGPTPLVEYIGSGRSSVVALAAGPDGLYFSELYEETGDNGPTAAGARIFRVRYVNPLAGDYDINGVVDGNDYLVWKQAYGSNLLLAADGNGDGIVDAADYLVWRNNVGNTLTPPAALALPLGVSNVPVALAAPSVDSETVDTALATFVPTRAAWRPTARPEFHVESNLPVESADPLLLLADRPATRGPIGTTSEPNAVDEETSNEQLDELFAEWGHSSSTVSVERSKS